MMLAIALMVFVLRQIASERNWSDIEKDLEIVI